MHFKAFTVISFNLIGVTDMTSHIDGGEDKDIDMFSDTNNLNLTRKDLELIEAALHTQQKILSVQSQAGALRAKQNLTDIKHLIQRLNRQTETKPNAAPSSWSQMARSLFC
jgi:hypothetical protein